MVKNVMDNPGKASKLHIYSAGFILVFQSLIVVSSVFFFIYKLINRTQMWLYQKSGEVLFSGTVAFITGLFLGICIIYWLLQLLIYIEKWFFPRLMKFFSVEGEIKFDVRKVKKVNNAIRKAMIIAMPIVIILVYASLNEYISLGKNYIAASSISLVPNRKEYAYSDVKIIEERENDGTVSYGFHFPDGKRNYGLLGNTTMHMRAVQSKQRELGLKVSEPELWVPTNKPNPVLGFLVLLISGSTYFFITWFMSRMEKRK